MRLSLLLVLLPGAFLHADAVTNTTGQDMVAEFKAYLSQPPCISRMIYAMEKTAEKNRQERFVLAYSPEAFYLRRIDHADNIDEPISGSNQMHSALLAGRSGTTRWQINQFNVLKSISVRADQPDPTASFAQALESMAGGIVNLGPQRIQPGSFVWSGNDFEAAASLVERQTDPLGGKVTGRIVVERGRVSRMEIGQRRYVYEYSASNQLPDWFPSHFTMFVTDKRIWKCSVEKVVFGKPENIFRTCLPEYHILPIVALETVVADGKTIVAPSRTNAEISRLVMQRHEGEKTSSKDGRRIVARLALASALLVPLALWLLWRLRSARLGTRKPISAAPPSASDNT